MEPFTTNESNSQFERAYVLSKRGILRILIIVFLLGGCISIGSLIKPVYFGSNVALTDVQWAYFFFGILGLILSLILFLFSLLRLTQHRRFVSWRWHLITAVTDIVFLLPMLALGVFCGLRESSLQRNDFFSNYYNYGSYAAASIFSLLLSIVYGISAFYELRLNQSSHSIQQFG